MENPYAAPRSEIRLEIGTELAYAGFWRRVGAVFVDSIVIISAAFVVGIVLAISGGLEGVRSGQNYDPMGNLVGVVIGWLYFALMESSSLQGTLGKLALGIRVTDINGQRIGFGRATGRHFAKILSVLILYIGFIMVAFTRRKQGLHDMVSGCLVVKK